MTEIDLKACEEFVDALSVAGHLVDESSDADLDYAFDVICNIRDQAQAALSAINAERYARTKAETDRLKAALAANG